MPIAFGSDGYRGVIGHGLTRDTVARIVLGVADYLRGQRPQSIRGLTLPIGYDTRFLSLPMARFAAALLAGEGLMPRLSNRACPSPYVSFATHFLKAPLGIQFTASHNPPIYGGVKLKGAHGGSMLPAEVAMLEFYAEAVEPDRYNAVKMKYERQADTNASLEKDYRNAIDTAASGAECKDQHIIVDYMHGSGAGIYRDLLRGWMTITGELRQNIDPLFGGSKPEPLASNLGELAELVRLDGHQAIGIAFDGDGDRLAVVDEAGQFLGPHEVLAILAEYLIKHCGKSGVIVKTVSLSSLVDRVAEAYGCKVYEVPVGFKSVSDAMLEFQAFIGGEESGGIGFGHYLPERDALLMALLLVKAMKAEGALLHDLVTDLYTRHGRQYFIHRDIPLTRSLSSFDMKLHLATLANLGAVAGDTVDSLNHRDGMKLRTLGGWVLVRASGTEPILRVYAEADTVEQANAYADEVTAYLKLG